MSPEESRLYVKGLNDDKSSSLKDRINHGMATRPGRITFSVGALWYTYKKFRTYHDHLGVPVNMKVWGVVSTDPEFMTHEWLADVYPRILHAKESCDPFHVRPPKHHTSLVFKGDNRLSITMGLHEESGASVGVAGFLDHVDLFDQSFMVRISQLTFS